MPIITNCRAEGETSQRPSVPQRGEPADDERASDIHQQRAPGKSLAELAGDETRTGKPGDAAQPTAKKYPDVAHKTSTVVRDVR